MKPLLSPNIGTRGRVVRGIGAMALLLGGWVALGTSIWLGSLLLGSGALVLFEALRGWCALRACGIKTRL